MTARCSANRPASLRDALAAVKISEVWTSLGGGPLRNGRGRAFWRDGDDHNISLNDRKNVWFDHVAGFGGGVLDLIQKALDCSRSDALRWLTEAFNLNVADRDFSPQARRRFARSKADAAQFLEWRDRYIDDLKERRTYYLRMYHAAWRWIIAHSLNHSLADKVADRCEEAEAAYLALDDEIDAFRALTTAGQIEVFRRESTVKREAA